ncbi:MAG: NAD(P)-dependent oxidoreductase [Betaproteobacteria bacterium]|nr:NAD(P)-dependent oxidoreductase [Betaproteobacteria bacterium]
MTTLVTGAGIIGSHTARMIAEKGDPVVLMDINPSYDPIKSIVDRPDVEIVQGDISNLDALCELIRARGVTRIVHTAAILNKAMLDDPHRGVVVNVLGWTNILEAARRLKLGRVVLASSGTVGYTTFGRFKGETFPEDFNINVVSERPHSLYTVSKLAGEHIALYYHDNYGVDAVIVRYAAVLSAWIGPNRTMPGIMLRSLLVPAIEGKTAVVDNRMLVWDGGEEFVDARDCAGGNVAALEAADPRSRVYNIGTGKMHTFHELIAEIRKLHPSLKVDIQVPIKGGMVGFKYVRPAPGDVKLAEAELGFRAHYDLGASISHFSDIMKATG